MRAKRSTPSGTTIEACIFLNSLCLDGTRDPRRNAESFLMRSLKVQKIAGVSGRQLYGQAGGHQILAGVRRVGSRMIFRADSVLPIYSQSLKGDVLNTLIAIGAEDVQRAALETGAPIEHSIPVVPIW